MRTYAWMIVTCSAMVTGLAGCGGDNSPAAPAASSANSAEQPPPTPSTIDFNIYAQSLVSTYSCDTNPPAEINNIDFTFVAADMGEPVDTTNDVPACKT